MAKDEEEWAFALLYGILEPHHPKTNWSNNRKRNQLSVRMTHRFLKPNSREEDAGRAALARALRDKPSGALLEALADVVEESGRLEFKRPKRLPPNWYQDRVIVLFIMDYVGKRKGRGAVAAAKQEAMEEFGLGEDTINQIWKRRKELMNMGIGDLQRLP